MATSEDRERRGRGEAVDRGRDARVRRQGRGPARWKRNRCLLTKDWYTFTRGTDGFSIGVPPDAGVDDNGTVRPPGTASFAILHLRQHRMRIVFFGNNYHRLSVACLEAVVDTGHEVTLGAFLPESSGLLNTARVAFQHGGVGAVARGGLRLFRARVGAKARAVAGSASGFSSLLEIADRRDLDTVDVTHVHRAETLEALRAATPDLIIVAGFSKILKREVIEIPRIACVNIHPSLLPAYRGPNPVYWVVANGERQTGVTAHFIDEGIDSGDIIDQEEVPIEPGAGEEDVFADCVEAAARLASRVVRQFHEGRVRRIPQDPALASYFSHPPKGASSL